MGIASVGSMVLLAAAMLAFDMPRRIFGETSLGAPRDAASLGVFLLAFAGISLPSDWIGGHLLPRRFGRSRETPARFITVWSRGVVIHGIVMLASGLLILWWGQWFGLPGAVAAVMLLILAMLVFQTRVAECVGGFRRTMPVDSDSAALPAGTLVLDATDIGFAGGLCGLPGMERHVIPLHWFKHLSPNVVHTQLIRRVCAKASGSRARGVILALAWNLAGFLLAAVAPRSDVTSVAGLVAISLWFTLWSFLGLLLLPTPSRAGVLEIDYAALRNGASLKNLQETIQSLDRLQDDEPVRPVGIETIFHPVPAVSTRLQALERARPHYGAWHAARMALVLSWPCLGLLARAVHCNSGRPELWVMLPSD